MSHINLSEVVSKDGKYIIPVSWTLISNVIVEADNLQDALDICQKRINNLPLGNGKYLEGSYHIDVENEEEVLEIQDCTGFGGVIIHKNGAITRY